MLPVSHPKSAFTFQGITKWSDWPGNLSVSAWVTRCPSCIVLRGHLSLSDVAIGTVSHFGAISHTESSLGQKGRLSVSW